MSPWRGSAESWETGTGLAGFHWPAPQARAAVLLQHGLSEYSERYVDQYHALIPHLQEQGYHVYAFDLEGHGRSSGVRGATDVETSVRHHLAARERLSSLGLPLFLMGHSLGGLVTATSVLERPVGIAGVILSSPALLVEAGAIRKTLARWLSRIFPHCPVGHLDPSGLSRVREKVEASLQDPLKFHGALKARMAASILRVSEANWRRYGEWNVPVLVVHGTADRYTSVEGSRRFIDAVKLADKTLLIEEGGYHELLNDLGADRVLAQLLGWLSRH